MPNHRRRRKGIARSKRINLDTYLSTNKNTKPLIYSFSNIQRDQKENRISDRRIKDNKYNKVLANSLSSPWNKSYHNSEKKREELERQRLERLHTDCNTFIRKKNNNKLKKYFNIFRNNFVMQYEENLDKNIKYLNDLYFCEIKEFIRTNVYYNRKKHKRQKQCNRIKFCITHLESIFKTIEQKERIKRNYCILYVLRFIKNSLFTRVKIMINKYHKVDRFCKFCSKVNKPFCSQPHSDELQNGDIVVTETDIGLYKNTYVLINEILYLLYNGEVFNFYNFKDKFLSNDNDFYYEQTSVGRYGVTYIRKICNVYPTKFIRLNNLKCTLYDYITELLYSRHMKVDVEKLIKSRFTFFDGFSFEDIIRYSKKDYVKDIYSLKLALLCYVKYKHKNIEYLFKKISNICSKYDINKTTFSNFEYIVKRCPNLYINRVITYSIKTNFLYIDEKKNRTYSVHTYNNNFKFFIDNISFLDNFVLPVSILIIKFLNTRDFNLNTYSMLITNITCPSFMHYLCIKENKYVDFTNDLIGQLDNIFVHELIDIVLSYTLLV